METKFTPGKWYVISSREIIPDINGKFTSKAVHAVYKRDGEYAHIADAETAEDAKLIAAAPELLRLVQRLLPAAQWVEASIKASDDDPLPKLIQEARAAITAATT